jgi:transposase InsO family protein
VRAERAFWLAASARSWDVNGWRRHPNELWSWDITKRLGPAKSTYFYLYVILDVFSRYVVGRMVAYGESAELAQRFIEETAAKQQILRGSSPSMPIAARR